MFGHLIKKIIGSRNERILKKMHKTVDTINALEPAMQALSDQELRAKTAEFKQRFATGKESLDSLLPEAFAVVREASQRVLGMRHFDVQLLGGMVLHTGKIAEMRTGEGKTLVATLSAYLNALSGQGMHIVTVNDYLAKRDAAWMGKIYEFLGLSVGVVVSGMAHADKQAAYAADITYGTNNEFGFDYLRDNMVFSNAERVQRELHYAIIDEVDSILIDEARTPLIISGTVRDSSVLYSQINQLIPKLQPAKDEDSHGDFTLDEKHRQAHLTEQGLDHIEELLTQHNLLQPGQSLYDPANIALMHHIDAALRAHFLYQKDTHYVVENQSVVIVDEFTGRKMPGRRWSEGLHQALEAKEGVKIQNESQTLASITFQNYFRLYHKLSGMTGTADTEAYEFQQIYGLEVVVIPTHKPMQRQDEVDQVFLNQTQKFKAIIEDIRDCVQRQQPVLVGTASIEVSEYLSKLLQQEKIKHEVLNAKQHQREAHIVAQAGRPGAVTIATNMAGRGTDIVLGGSLEAELAELTDPEQIAQCKADWQQRHAAVIAAGGLRIIGTERHESRRIDNQLRGRAGRQGDPGSSQFYLSLEDNLIRIFANDRIASLMQKFGMKEDEVIIHPLVSRVIENSQRKVEAYNFDVRKNVLEYDDVANEQRITVYDQRKQLMNAADISDSIQAIREGVLSDLMNRYMSPNMMEQQWDIPVLTDAIETTFAAKLPLSAWLEQDKALNAESLGKRVLAEISAMHTQKMSVLPAERVRSLEKLIMLQVLDAQWKEHLAAMDYLRQSIGLRGYANKNPKQEYKREAFQMFANLLSNIETEAIRLFSHLQLRQADAPDLAAPKPQQQDMTFSHPQAQDALHPEEQQASHLSAKNAKPFVREQQKIGRNSPCHCGSGKKYKHCHGKLEQS